MEHVPRGPQGLPRQAGRPVASAALRPDALPAEQDRDECAPAAPGRDPGGGAETDPVLRVFFREGRLTSIPSRRAKRVVVLDRLAQAFEPGRRYPESEVNATIARFHLDSAALRRYLVDEGFLAREHGVYWRSGGTFSVD
ncbi:MAG: DUF2087 domain-containing protein [Actinomycetota bacterium]